jgi:hypothetical protein
VVLFAYTSPFDSRRSFVGFTKLIKGCSNRIIASSYAVVVFDCDCNFKAILDFIKDFSYLPSGLVAILSFLKLLFFGNFVLRKQGLQKNGQQEQESDFYIEEGIC